MNDLGKLLNWCFVSGVMPNESCSACIVLLYKDKVDRNECCNSRGIGLLFFVGNLFEKVPIKRIGTAWMVGLFINSLALGVVEGEGVLIRFLQ